MGVVVLLVGVLPLPGAAERARVLVIGPEDGAVAALRIQLAATADVTAREAELPAGLADAITAAEGLRAGAGAALAVWIERATEQDGVRVVVMHAVGRRAGTLLTRVFRARGADDAELERAVALDAASTLDVLLEASARDDRSLLEALATERGQRASADGPGLAVEVSGGARAVPSSAAVQWLLAARVGPTLRHDRLALAVLVGGAWAPPVERMSASGSAVELEELEVRAGVSVELDLTDWIAAGVTAEGIVRFMRATGTDAALARGEAELTTGAAALLAQAGARLVPGLELRVFFGAELSPVAERLAVHGEIVMDLGNVRLLAGLGVRLSIP